MPAPIIEPASVSLSLPETVGPDQAVVQAWARDIATGEPRYIMELGSHRRGARCGCDCPSCNLPLIAVNAARSTWQRRPHFRHPAGTEASSCSVLTARLAALRAYRDLGWIDLPGRRVTARFVGLTGRVYEAQAARPPERIRISEADFSDPADATLLLQDGRRLRVKLAGSVALDGDRVVPTIVIGVDDDVVQAMSPTELRSRLSLDLDEGCWATHWEDDALLKEAAAEAQRQADEHFDADTQNFDQAELPPELRRETLLHVEVKRILDRTGSLVLPALVLVECDHLRSEAKHVESHRVDITNVKLESRFGRTIPDVLCDAGESPLGELRPLAIEVTVTNTIDDARLERIRAAGLASLEIDLRKAAGRVTRSGLERLVVDETSLKSWLHLPGEAAWRADLRMRLSETPAPSISSTVEPQAPVTDPNEAPVPGIAPKRLDHWTCLSPTEAAAAYLRAVSRVCECSRHAHERRTRVDLDGPRTDLLDAQLALRQHGYPEVSDACLDDTHGIVPRVLSIRENRGVGYRFPDAFSVLNSIFQTTGFRRWELTIYLIAWHVYRPSMTPAQSAKVHAWASEVRYSIRSGKTDYLRPNTFDRLLALLFPEMAEALLVPRLHRSTDQ